MYLCKAMDLDSYLAAHTSAEPERLYRLWRHTNMHHLYPRMCSGHVQGRLLKLLTAMCAPQRILEIGTYTGYATLCMAEGMPDGCTIDTVEIDDEMADELSATFAADPRGADIHLHIGDALEIVPGLAGGDFDLVYLDANKRLYGELLEAVLPRLRKGGFILADNTLWDGHLLSPETCRDAQSRALARFNDMVAADPRIEQVIIPVRDGLTLMRKL